MTEYVPNYSFDTDTLTLSVSLTGQDLEYFKDDPGKLLGGARLKLSGYISSGKICGYYLCEDEFMIAWDRICSRPSFLPLQLPVAYGFPSLEFITLSKDRESNQFSLSLQHPGKGEINPSWVYGWVLEQCKKNSFRTRLSPADVTCIMFRSSGSKTAGEYLVGPAPFKVPEVYDKAWHIKVRRESGQIDLILGKSARKLIGKEEVIIEEVREKIREVTRKPGSSGYYLIFEERIRDALKSLTTGYSALNMLLPVVELAAMELRITRVAPQAFKFDLHYCNTVLNSGSIPHLNGEQVRFTGIKRWNATMIQYMRDYLDACRNSLQNMPSKRRNLQSMLLAIDDASAGKIASYIEDLLATLTMGKFADPEKVLVTGAQLIPLTRVKSHSSDSESGASSAVKGVWQKALLREIVGLDNFKNDPSWIQSKLIPRISMEEISTGLKSLEQSGFIISDKLRGGRLVQSTKNVLTGDGSKGEFLTQYHNEVLSAASEFLETGDQDRQKYWVSFQSISEADFKVVQAKVKDQLAKIFDESAEAYIPDQLYILNIQSFLAD